MSELRGFLETLIATAIRIVGFAAFDAETGEPRSLATVATRSAAGRG
jgi:hypothetical protein